MRRDLRACARILMTCVAVTWPVAAQDLPRGMVIPRVVVADDPAQSYALYLPSDYTPDRAWNLLLAFHPSARGQDFVERYQAAAERYGYIIAGSNTSRNGPWDVVTSAVRGMSRDVGRRFSIDADRIYVTGHSGGARVAMDVALGRPGMAGVIASSAGFPDAKPRATVGFPVFATVGIDDFNFLEMQRLNERLSSPHHLAVFDGGHTLPPEDVARQALEWMELQAIRAGRRPAGDLVTALFADRQRQIATATDSLARLRVLQAIVADFTGLRDVAEVQAQAAALAKEPQVKDAQRRARADLDHEARLLDEALALEARLRNPAQRTNALEQLGTRFAGWSRAAAADQASPARSQARRLLGAIAAGAAERTDDEEYRALVSRYRWRP